MQPKQATGIDTRAMVPLYVYLYVILCTSVCPWISIPVLKYSRLSSTYSFWNVAQCVDNIQKSVAQGGYLHMEPFSGEELHVLKQFALGLKGMAVALICLMVLCAIATYIMYFREQGKQGTQKGQARELPREFSRELHKRLVVRGGFAISFLTALLTCILVLCVNLYFNQRMGRENTFLNLSIYSYVQLTSWQYGQMLLSALLFFFAGRLLDTQAEPAVQTYVERTIKEDNRMGARTKMAFFMIALAIPCVIFFGIFFLNDRSEIFISLCIIGLAMVPFAMVFEERKPQAREILLIAVMSAIAVAGRMAFFMIPQFKPVTAIVIITGAGLGAEAGFLTGAMAGFVSNFFFGQGPWTPWQMFSFGIIGFLAGLLFHRRNQKTRTRGQEWRRKILLCVYGGLATFFIYGILMDTASVTMIGKDLSWKAFAAAYLSGVPFNLIHASSSVIFLFFLAVPMERKLDRIKKKYGLYNTM